MATNVYFSPKVKQEQNLYEDIVIEALKMYGQDVIYLPRNLVSYDNITNSEFSEFVDAYAVEMYIENTEGFGGEGDLMSKFGLEIRDTATFVVSKRRWEQLVGIWNNSLNSERPSEGDLIYLPLSNSLFEIKMTEHEQPFYQLIYLYINYSVKHSSTLAKSLKLVTLKLIQSKPSLLLLMCLRLLLLSRSLLTKRLSRILVKLTVMAIRFMLSAKYRTGIRFLHLLSVT
jgi:hypothetical protein